MSNELSKYCLADVPNLFVTVQSVNALKHYGDNDHGTNDYLAVILINTENDDAIVNDLNNQGTQECPEGGTATASKTAAPTTAAAMTSNS